MILVTLAALLGAACDDRGPDPAGAAPAPAGYSGYIVYIADGVWDPADPSVTTPTLADHARTTWGFSDGEFDQFNADARSFYSQRFGVDLDDPANAERLSVVTYVADDRVRYRVVTMANHEVPPEGWPVSDAGYLVTIVDPAGFELGGEFAGVFVPTGVTMVYGRYQFETDRGESIAIAFQSLTPYLTDGFGIGAFRCGLASEALGAGEAFGAFHLAQLPNGEFSSTVRNVLTFPGP